ncbi:MAG: nucleoside-diphosphate kinase [Thermotogae bacterium]|nr:nucleoside-diphosphate kinase [Thermotogota bacterium]
MVEQTLVFIKPDGVEKGIVGRIITRFENKGYKMKALKMFSMSRQFAEEHYAEHAGKPFFNALIDFVTRGPVVALILEGEAVILTVRKMLGTTNPLEAAPGTIRGDFAIQTTENIIHASSDEEAARREIEHFFGREAVR